MISDLTICLRKSHHLADVHMELDFGFSPKAQFQFALCQFGGAWRFEFDSFLSVATSRTPVAVNGTKKKKRN